MTTKIIITMAAITAVLLAYIAYEMAHAYELPEDEECEEDNSQHTQQPPTPTSSEGTETKNSLENAE